MNKKVDYKIISAKDFIKAKPSGEFDRVESKKVLIEIATLAGCTSDCDILLDVREAHAKVMHVDIYDFVTELGKHRSVFRNKIAVLSRNDIQFDNAHFIEVCAKNRGFMAAAFVSFEEAINWLDTFTGVDVELPRG